MKLGPYTRKRAQERRAHRERLPLYIAVAFMLYFGLSMMVFSLCHPELTDTQRFLRIFEALTWSWAW